MGALAFRIIVARHLTFVGFHVDDMCPVTFAAVYRWFQAANETLFIGYGGYESSFRLFPVVIEPKDVYCYNVRISGDAVPWDSQEAILPGDYGLFAEGQNSSLLPLPAQTHLLYRRLSSKTTIWIQCDGIFRIFQGSKG